MTQPDPSVKRQSGLLVPSIGSTSRLGFFTTLPYFIVINKSSDVTLTPIIGVKTGPVLDAKYRKAFNNGDFEHRSFRRPDSEGSGGIQFRQRPSSRTVPFDLNQNWRAGFNPTTMPRARTI